MEKRIKKVMLPWRSQKIFPASGRHCTFLKLYRGSSGMGCMIGLQEIDTDFLEDGMSV